MGESSLLGISLEQLLASAAAKIIKATIAIKQGCLFLLNCF